MNEKPTEKVEKLPIITKFCMTIGQLPTSYLMSMTYLEQVTWLCNFLEKEMIPALNQNAKAVQELQSLFELLRTYVNDYFDNLDVQEEINNKLDQMLEDGVLEQIIEQFLQSSSLWCFDNVADMKEATNLIDGSFAKTMGYHQANDGGSATYKIRTKTEDVTDEMFLINISDTLVAELIYFSTINIKELGAYGDGEHDDSSIINTSLNKVTNTYLPAGTYLINTAITIPSNKNLYGDGITSIIKAGDELYHLIYVTMSENINVHDLYLTGNAKERETNNFLNQEIYGMSIDFSKNIVVDNVTFTDMGFTRDPVSGGNMLSLNINEEYDNKQNTENCIINNCKFIDPEFRSSFGIRLYSEWDLENDRKYYVKNNKISNCYFTGLSYNGIEVGGTGTIYNILENNMFENMKCIIPLEADKGASYNHFINNIVKNLETAPNQNQNSFAFKDGSSGIANTQSIGNVWIGNSAYNIKQNVAGASGGMEIAGAKDTIVSDLIIDSVIPYNNENTNSVGLYITNSISNNCENIQINNSKIMNINKGNGIQILSAYTKNILINNNEIYNVNYGIRTTTTSSLGNIIVESNNIHDCTNNGININQNTKIQVKNNYIENVVMGIFSNDGANGTITGNVIDSSSYSIRLNGDNTNFYVANNDIKYAFYMPDTNKLNKIINNNISDYQYNVPYVKQVKYGTGIPENGSFHIGDIIYNTNPVSGGYIGWVCVSDGTPGSWKGFGMIE